MATKMWLSLSSQTARPSLSASDQSTTLVEGGRGPTLGAGSNPLGLVDTNPGSTSYTLTRSTVTGPTDPGLLVDPSDYTTGGPVWLSRPLTSAVTISGTITFSLWANESSMSANVYARVVVWKVTPTGGSSVIIDSLRGTELGTSLSEFTWTGTPTSTDMAKGDMLMVGVYFSSGGSTMAAGYTATLGYGAGDGFTGDSFITFTETFSQSTQTVPGGTILNMLTAASDISGSGKKKMWTDTIANPATYTTTCGAIPEMVQMTDTGGGTALSWYSPPLTAVTFDNEMCTVVANSWCTSAGRAFAYKIYKCDSDGSNEVHLATWRIWAVGTTSSSGGSAYGWLNGSLTDGQRLIVRLYATPGSTNTNSADSMTHSTRFADSAVTVTYLRVNSTLTEYSAGPPTVTTKLYLHADQTNVIRPPGGPVDSSTAFTDGAATPTARLLTATAGTSVTSEVTASAAGPITAPGLFNDANSLFISPPLATAVTIALPITFNIWASEADAAANAAITGVVWRIKPDGTETVIATLANTTELGTTDTEMNWYGAVTSTACAIGDMIAVGWFFDDATAVTMASGHDLTVKYDAADAAIGDSWVGFGETLTFSSSPVGTVLNFTNDEFSILPAVAASPAVEWSGGYLPPDASTSTGWYTAHGATFFKGNFYCWRTARVDASNTQLRLYKSPDPRTGSWARVTSLPASLLVDNMYAFPQVVSTADYILVATPNASYYRYAYSSNGTDWTYGGDMPTGSASWQITTPGNDRFHVCRPAVSSSWYTPAGEPTSWTEWTVSTGDARVIQWDGTYYVAVGTYIWTATTLGGAWTLNSTSYAAMGSGDGCEWLVYGDGKWLATGLNMSASATDPTGTWSTESLTYGAQVTNGTYWVGMLRGDYHFTCTSTDPTNSAGWSVWRNSFIWGPQYGYHVDFGWWAYEGRSGFAFPNAAGASYAPFHDWVGSQAITASNSDTANTWVTWGPDDRPDDNDADATYQTSHPWVGIFTDGSGVAHLYTATGRDGYKTTWMENTSSGISELSTPSAILGIYYQPDDVDSDVYAVLTTNTIYYTTDPTGSWSTKTVQWTPSTSARLAAISGVWYAVIGTEVWYLSAVSPGGTWTQNTNALASAGSCISSDPYGVVWVGLANGGIVYAASASGTWTAATSPFSAAVNKFHWGVQGGTEMITAGVAVANSGQLATATTYPFTTWTSRTSNFGSSNILTIAVRGSSWAIAGDDGKMATAGDITGTWTLRAGPWSSVHRISHLHSHLGAWVAGFGGDSIAWPGNDAGVTYKKLWLDTPPTSDTLNVSTANAPTVTQWSGEWLTPELPLTVDVQGRFTADIQGYESNASANVTVLLLLYSTSSTGGAETQIGQGRGRLEFSTSAARLTFEGHISAALTAGQRIKARLYASSPEGSDQATGYTASLVIGEYATSARTRLQLPAFLTIPPAPIAEPITYHRPRLVR